MQDSTATAVDQVTVVALPHPLKARTHRLVVAASGTIDDLLVAIVEQTGVRPELLRHAAVEIEGRVVPKAMWAHTRPAAGTTVSVRALPGDDIGSIFVQVIGLVAAFYVPTLFPALKGFALAATRVAIAVGTSLAAQALAPSPSQHLSRGNREQPDAAHSIHGVRNVARPYEAVPVIYGLLVNYHPPLAALPYTEVSGNEQVLRSLFCAGFGSVTTSTYRFGSTPVTTLKDVTIQAVDGSGSTNTSLFPRQVREESLSIELKQVDGYSQRRTEPNSNEVLLDFMFPNGLFRLSARNVQFSLRVDFEVQYRTAAGGAWTAAPLVAAGGFAVPAGGGTFYVHTSTRAAVRPSIRFVLPAQGQYDVRVRRLTQDDQSEIPGVDEEYNTVETSYWTSIRSVENSNPINIATGLCMIAVRAQASNQLNGVLETFNMTVQRRLPVWNGSTWTTQATRNPAWAYVDVLTGAANARPISTARIDLAQMLTWASYCASEGLTFDAAITSITSVWELLQDIAATGHASPTYVDGQYSVVIDTTRTTAVQVFTPRNSWGFRATKLFGNFPHALKVRFPNQATEHQVDERIVYDDGYTAANATRFEVLDFPYCTNATVAWKNGRRALAAARLRSEIFTIEVDFEHLRCTRSDLVRLVHDVPLLALGAARCTAVDGAGPYTITVDAPFAVNNGVAYTLRVRQAGGDITGIAVTSSGTDGAIVEFDTSASAGNLPAVGDLVVLEETGTESLECLVRSIEPRHDHSAVITLIPYKAAVYTAASAPIPDYDPQITLPPVVNRATPQKPALFNVASDETAAQVNNNGRVQPAILLTWALNQNAGAVPAEIVQIQWRQTLPGGPDPHGIATPANNEWRQVAVAPDVTVYAVMPVESGGTYELRLRTVSQFGAASAWTTHTEVVVGFGAPPPSIERMFREGDFLIWSYPNAPLDFAGFRARANYGTNLNWASARALHDGLLADTRLSIAGLSGTQTILVKAVDVVGNESLEAVSVTINLGDAFVANIIDTQSEAPDFTGTITGGTVNTGVLEADVLSDEPFYGPPTAPFYGAAGDPVYPDTIFAKLIYVASWTPASDQLDDGILRLDLDIDGAYAVDFRIYTSPAFYGDAGDPFYGAVGDPFYAAGEVSAWATWPGELGPFESIDETYQLRITVPSGSTQGAITEFDLLLDVPDIVEHFDDVAIAGTTGTRLTLTQTYRAIDNIQITRQDDGGDGVSAEWVDKQANAGAAGGPLIKVYDAASPRNVVAGNVDVTIKGR